MAIFTVYYEKLFVKYFCNTRVCGLGEIFVKQKFLAVLYMYMYIIVVLLLMHVHLPLVSVIERFHYTYMYCSTYTVDREIFVDNLFR